jgi:predicted site-specific integrase-resolvase
MTGLPAVAVEDGAESFFLTPREVCDLLHIGSSTLRDWRRDGLVEGHQLPSGAWRYPANQSPLRRAREALRARA